MDSPDQPFLLTAYAGTPTGLQFEHTFHTNQPVNGARLTVRAFRRCIVKLDEATIYVGPENLDTWQEPRDVRLPVTVQPGDHVLQIMVLNRDAQPCLLAYCDKLEIHTGPDWTVVRPDGHRSLAITVTQHTQPEVAQTYPSISAATIRVAPVLAVVFALTFAWSLWTSRTSKVGASRQLRSQFVRWGLLVAWVILSANNIDFESNGRDI